MGETGGVVGAAMVAAAVVVRVGLQWVAAVSAEVRASGASERSGPAFIGEPGLFLTFGRPTFQIRGSREPYHHRFVVQTPGCPYACRFARPVPLSSCKHRGLPVSVQVGQWPPFVVLSPAML